MSARKQSGLWLFLAMTLLHVSAAWSDQEIPRDLLKGIEAMRRLPVEGVQLVQAQGQLLIVSTNGHYVITGGRLIDLWNNLRLVGVACLGYEQPPRFMPSPQPAYWEAGLVLAGVCILCLSYLNRRTRAVEVIR